MAIAALKSGLNVRYYSYIDDKPLVVNTDLKLPVQRNMERVLALLLETASVAHKKVKLFISSKILNFTTYDLEMIRLFLSNVSKFVYCHLPVTVELDFDLEPKHFFVSKRTNETHYTAAFSDDTVYAFLRISRDAKGLLVPYLHQKFGIVGYKQDRSQADDSKWMDQGYSVHAKQWKRLVSLRFINGKLTSAPQEGIVTGLFSVSNIVNKRDFPFQLLNSNKRVVLCLPRAVFSHSKLFPTDTLSKNLKFETSDSGVIVHEEIDGNIYSDYMYEPHEFIHKHRVYDLRTLYANVRDKFKLKMGINGRDLNFSYWFVVANFDLIPDAVQTSLNTQSFNVKLIPDVIRSVYKDHPQSLYHHRMAVAAEILGDKFVPMLTSESVGTFKNFKVKISGHLADYILAYPYTIIDLRRILKQTENNRAYVTNPKNKRLSNMFKEYKDLYAERDTGKAIYHRTFEYELVVPYLKRLVRYYGVSVDEDLLNLIPGLLATLYHGRETLSVLQSL